MASEYSTTRDRKSTRLNSSHLVISYAVFCLKKKTAFLSPRTTLTPSPWAPRPVFCESGAQAVSQQPLTPFDPSRCETRKVFCIFFFNDTATTEIYTLSLHDALPI